MNGCPRTYGGSHPFSQAETSGGISAAIDLGKLPNGTNQIIAALGGQLTISTTVSNGGNFTCATGLFTILDNNTYEEWNYRKSSTGGYYANWFSNYSVNNNGIWSNATSGNGVPPSPFVANNTTYSSHYFYTENYGFCEAVVTSFYNAYALVYDKTSGNYTNSTATSWPVFAYIEQYLHTDTDFGVERKNTWDGVTSTWSNSSIAYTLNSSGFLTDNYTYPQGTSKYWYNSSLSVLHPQNTYVNLTTVKFGGDTSWFNQSFATTDHYYLILFFHFDQTAWTYDYGYNNNNWRNAYATYAGDALRPRNGVAVVSIMDA